jgi:hypothetical protein
MMHNLVDLAMTLTPHEMSPEPTIDKESNNKKAEFVSDFV